MNVLQVHTTSVAMSYPMSWHLPSNLKTIERLQLVTIKLDYWSIRFFEIAKQIKVITKLPNSEQSYKGKVKTHNYINRQNQSTTGKL